MVGWMFRLSRGAKPQGGPQRGQTLPDGLDRRSCVNRISYWVLSFMAFILYFYTFLPLAFLCNVRKSGIQM